MVKQVPCFSTFSQPMSRFRLQYFILMISAAFLMTLIGCDLHKSKVIDPEKINFRTLEDTELFFKNLRQTYYDKEAVDSAGIDKYRFEDRVLDSGRPIINLMIVHNWRTDMAYIFIEPNSFFPSDTLQVFWQASDGKAKGSYPYQKSNVRSQLLFATQLYGSLQQEHRLWVEKEGQKYALLTDEASIEAFRITMVDFYRLVRAL